MKVIQFAQFGIDNLESADRPAPELAPGHVLVKVDACSLNYRDLLMVEGKYNPRIPLPLVPVSDGVGTVVAVGPDGPDDLLGHRVAAMFCQDWISGPPSRATIRNTLGGPADGMLAEMVALPATGVHQVPEYLSNEEAATLPCAALTAWSALVDEGNLKPGQTVLIQGTGGVSIFALQFALFLGARVIITSSSDAKLARAAVLGAHHCINYKSTTDWGKRAKQFTKGEGVDLVIEVGGALTLAESIRAVRVGGTICQIGVLSGQRAPIDVTPILMRNLRIQGVLVGSTERFGAMCRALESSEIRPVVDRVFDFENALQAFRYLEGAQHLGKTVIRVP